MPNFTYSRDIPFEDNNPSEDQPNMKTNTNSTDSILDVDHFSFNNNSGGFHKQVTMPSFSGGTPTTAAGQGALYVKTDSAGQQALWFIRDGFALSNVQLTTSKILAPKIATNGYTFLPGAILLQWGTIPIAASGTFTTVTFATSNIAFPTACFNVVLTMINNQGASASANSVFVRSGSVSATSFQITNTSSSAAQSVYWIAIGN